jgi:integrase
VARKHTSGLVCREGTWHIDKVIRGKRVCESTGTCDFQEAERYLAHRMEEIRQAEVYGVRPPRTFRQAATRHLDEATKRSIDRDASLLKVLDPFIGQLPLTGVHMGTLQRFIQDRKRAGWKMRTINYALQVVRRVLNLAANEWIDEYGLTWLAHAPKIKCLPEDDKKLPYPISWEEQRRLLAELPPYLRDMALFKVNTGCRDQEVCRLMWDWEVEVPELDTSVFIIPGRLVKNGEDRLVALNRTAQEVVEDIRGKHPTHVFSYNGHPVSRMHTHTWMRACERAGLPGLRVHDLKHTFGRRLRAAGVSFEDRQDLLGHKSTRITTHYSRAELVNLIAAANKVCEEESRKSPALVILKNKSRLAMVG